MLIEQATSIGLRSSANLFPTVLLSMVNLILPTITISITMFEQVFSSRLPPEIFFFIQWDDMLDTTKQQTWRLYFGRILNLIVAGLQFYSLRGNAGDPILTIFEQSVENLKENIGNGYNWDTHLIQRLKTFFHIFIDLKTVPKQNDVPIVMKIKQVNSCLCCWFLNFL